MPNGNDDSGNNTATTTGGDPIDHPPRKPVIYAAYAVTAASTVYVAKAIHDWIFCTCTIGI